MNKVYLMGKIFNLKNEVGNAGKVVTRFELETKKLVGYGKKDTISYDIIPCDIRGKKATYLYENCREGTKVALWGRLDLDQENHLSIAVDEIDII